jgi:hypothetical protein
MVKRSPILDKVWSASRPYFPDLLSKSGFDINRVANFSLELGLVRGSRLEQNYPPTQSILFNSQFRMNFHNRIFKLIVPEKKKFKINLTKELSTSQYQLASGFADPYEYFANLFINEKLAGSVVDLETKVKDGNAKARLRYLILPSIPTTLNQTTIDFFKRLNDFIITELEWEPVENIPTPTSPRISVIGTDPEFELIHNGDVVRACNYFDGHDIGHDGAGSQLEIRPKPTDNIEELITNIKQLFEKITNKSFAIGTAGNSIPIGSHIHFGGINNFAPYPDYMFLQLLDNWLYHPLEILNGAARNHFAQPSAQRRKQWGFEYRSLPSGIFINPTLAKAVFKTAKCLADKWYNFEEIEELPKEKDYLEFLTPEEFSFIKNAKKLKPTDSQKSIKSFMANWKLNEKTQFYATLKFRDEWPTRANDYSQVKCSFGNCTIVLFGLKKRNTYSIINKTTKIPTSILNKIEKLFTTNEFIKPMDKIDFTHKKGNSIEADLLIGVSPDFRRGNQGTTYLFEKLEKILWPQD